MLVENNPSLQMSSKLRESLDGLDGFSYDNAGEPKPTTNTPMEQEEEEEGTKYSHPLCSFVVMFLAVIRLA